MKNHTLTLHRAAVLSMLMGCGALLMAWRIQRRVVHELAQAGAVSDAVAAGGAHSLALQGGQFGEQSGVQRLVGVVKLVVRLVLRICRIRTDGQGKGVAD